MYSVKPLGINIKDSDYDVQDGFLLESINAQWRDGALRPVPERIISDIDVAGYSNIILHKVSDENQINVLGFKDAAPNKDVLYWIGTITNGVYASIAPVTAFIVRTSGMSFTILNGLIYFMGDGSSTTEQYYHRIQFIESSSIYEVKDMYAWKTLIPFYPFQTGIEVVAPAKTIRVFSECGMILIRFAVVLKSGEIVLHSPIYPFALAGLNTSDSTIAEGTTIDNIHAFINLNLEYLNTVLFEEEVSAINVYATTPVYNNILTQEYSTPGTFAVIPMDSASKIGMITTKSEEPFYLVRTISTPTNDKLLLTVGQLDNNISYSVTASAVDISTIAAGEIMPVDNFSYHYVYGHITSNNGRIIVDKPTTVLSAGHIRSLATEDYNCNSGFRIDTEDGKISGISYIIDKSLNFAGAYVYPRGVMSYPDSRATVVGGSEYLTGAIDGTSINTAGAGYLVNDILTISGGAESATIKATEVVGEIVTLSISNAGTGYAPTNVITVSGGGGNAIIIVQTVGGSGEVTSYTLSNAGTGYSVASAVATTGGAGTNFAINILTTKGAISAYTIEKKGSGYSVATGVTTTVLPAGGTGFKINITSVFTSVLKLLKTKKNALHNMACSYYISYAGYSSGSAVIDGSDIKITRDYNVRLGYYNIEEEVTSPPVVSAKYNSENRVQFSEAGEFSVWPALNSYRVGEGKIMAVGSNSVNPSDTLTVASLIVGTTDGVYTFNFDPTGNTLGYFTKTASIPYLSKETLQIGDQLLFISERGLIAFNGGDPKCLTEEFFPNKGNGNFPVNETVFPNYNLITTRYFGGTGNPYVFVDIVEYLKDALLAYDSTGGRETIWCSNPNKTYSLTYSIKTGQWGMNTLVFTERPELFSILDTSEGDVYSRYLVKKAGEDNLLILSGEDSTKEVEFHIMTRPIKMQYPDAYKKISRLISRCEYFRKNTGTGYFAFGVWGKQDANKNKINIPLVAIDDISADSFPDDVRQDIPIGSQKGKYKFITILQGGKALPESSINRFDIEAHLVDEKQLR